MAEGRRMEFKPGDDIMYRGQRVVVKQVDAKRNRYLIIRPNGNCWVAAHNCYRWVENSGVEDE